MSTILARRDFLSLTACAAVGALGETGPLSLSNSEAPVEAVLFDAFPIFDPRPIFALAEELFPGRGAELSKVWRTRQFEYTWLRTVAGRYVDFWHITEDALVFAAKDLRLDLNARRRARLLNAYLELKAWADVPQALKALKSAGIRLGFLSNFSSRMLEVGIRNSGLDGLFELFLSTDAVKQFKPSPRAYQMAVDAFGVKRDAMVFAAFAGWDASGAKWFGLPTVWVNRLGSTAEELDVSPDLICTDLSGLVTFATSRR